MVLGLPLLPVYPPTDRGVRVLGFISRLGKSPSPRGRLSHFLPLSASAAICQSSVSHVVPSFLAAHFAAFCSLYSLTPATLLSKVLAPVP